ncbi:MAG TPA: hypothetical protein VHD90_22045 [Phototrophicaceae bacterium]|nr:hypothetical protein [Phototrophicaceae bacterium]
MGKLLLRKMGQSYRNVLSWLELYKHDVDATIPRTREERLEKARQLENRLRTINELAVKYTKGHEKERKKGVQDSRIPFFDNLANQAITEIRVVKAVATDVKYNTDQATFQWNVEIKLRQFDSALKFAEQTVEVSAGIDQRMQQIYSLNNVSEQEKRERTAPLTKQLLLQDTAKFEHYQDALEILLSTPAIVEQLPLRKLNQALIEAGRSAPGNEQGSTQEKLFQIQSLDAVHRRILHEVQQQETAVNLKINQVKADLLNRNAQFQPNEFVQLASGEEDIAVICGIIGSRLQERGVNVPGWAEYSVYRAENRVKQLTRLFHQVNPVVTFAQLPPALRSPFTLLRQANPLADWIKDVLSESPRLQGQSLTSVETVRDQSGIRATVDYQKALERLQNELHVPGNEVEEVLKKSLLVLARAPLTVNFNHQKLRLILASGGFKNYWQVNPEYLPGGDDVNQQKYEYQQTRLEGEGRLYGHSRDVTTKLNNAPQGTISTGANIANHYMGSAPTRDYGRSVAVLKERVKERATYTPWDALQLMTRIRSGATFVGPEVVATSDNLAAIIRYTDLPTLKDIVERAKNPKKVFDMPVSAYVEAAIHGPLTIQDIARITINEEDLEDEAYEDWESKHGGRADPVAIKNFIDQVKLNIQNDLGRVQVEVGFASFG